MNPWTVFLYMENRQKTKMTTPNADCPALAQLGVGFACPHTILLSLT